MAPLLASVGQSKEKVFYSRTDCLHVNLHEFGSEILHTLPRITGSNTRKNFAVQNMAATLIHSLF